MPRMTPAELDGLAGSRPGFAKIRQILGAPAYPLQIIEIGAFDMFHTRMMIGFCRRSPRVWSFEADPRNVAFIRREGPPAEVVFIPAAVGGTTGRVPFHLATPEPNGCIGSSSLSAFTPALTEAWPWLHEDGIAEVDCFRLDDMFNGSRQNPWRAARVELLWMDVQGAERQVLEGAAKLLADGQIRHVWTEHDQGYEESVTMDDLVALLPGFRLELEDGPDVLFARAS